ncbi:MAG: hypothetical protein IJC05_07385 [Phascolarctobacterium sp.]|nr:hypothetical protein [Phascolarctobacterium sp.]
MFKILLLAAVVITSIFYADSVFAEVGPLSSRYQDVFRKQGCYLVKFNDYTQTDMWAFQGYKQKKRKPSAVVIVAQYGEDRYKKSIGKTGIIVELEKGEKHYKLDMKRNNGVVYNAMPKNSNFSIKGNGRMFLQDTVQLPTALTFLIPDELKMNLMKQDADTYKYYGVTTENINGNVFQCETYGVDTPQMKKVYKLYFSNGIITKYAHGERLAEVLEIKTDFDTSIFTIPKGFTIYNYNANVLPNYNKGMDDLLKNKNGLVIAEQY